MKRISFLIALLVFLLIPTTALAYNTPTDPGRLSLIQVENGQAVNQRDHPSVSASSFNFVTGRTALRQAFNVVGLSNVMFLPVQDNVSLSEGTISFWVKKSDWSNTQDNFFFREDVTTSYFTNDSFSIRKFSDGNLYAGFEVVRAAANVSALDPDAWHLITLTYAPNENILLYIDGSLASTGPQYDGSAVPDTSRGQCASICWGGWQGVSYANGIMEDMETFDYRLTATQINNLYNSTSPEVFYTVTSPVVNPFPGAIINEGAMYSASGTFTQSDPTTWTATVNYGDGSGTQPLVLTGHNFNLNHVYADNGAYTVTVTVTDGDGASDSNSATVNVNNVAPTVNSITTSSNPTIIGTSVSASATFTDPGTLDTHTAVWNWGDGITSSGAITDVNGSGTVSGSHTYAAAGVYTVTVTVTDNDNASTPRQYEYVSVYPVNVTARIIAGSVSYISPVGAYSASPLLNGEVRFGVEGMRTLLGLGATTGAFKLDFAAANFIFQSTTASTLSSMGARSTLQGTGTVNGSGSYSFVVSVNDGQRAGGGGVDRIRVKITNTATNTVVYDTQPGAGNNAAPTLPLSSGSIIIP